jgi:DNA-binding response OmpR family regulator
LETCRRLQSISNQVPIILLTAKDEESNCVVGLDAGAEDYVVKPFSAEELLARVHAQLRRNRQATAVDILEFEDLSLNRRTREVYRCQRLVELTAKEFDLLEYLLAHPRQVITRDRILQEIWDYNFIGDTNVIEDYIRYLCLKLEANNEKRLIQTVHDVGYVLRD